MRARIIQAIEVEIGNVRRYFTADGEPIGIVSAEGRVEAADEAPVSVEELVAQVPRKRRVPPPFDPAGPVLRPDAHAGGGDE